MVPTRTCIHEVTRSWRKNAVIFQLRGGDDREDNVTTPTESFVHVTATACATRVRGLREVLKVESEIRKLLARGETKRNVCARVEEKSAKSSRATAHTLPFFRTTYR